MSFISCVHAASKNWNVMTNKKDKLLSAQSAKRKLYRQENNVI